MSPDAERAADLLDQLVAFDTTSHKSNLDLVEFVAGYLSKFDVESARVVSADGTKANLFATIGPPDVGGVALSGHTDVVPVDGQDWTSDPFKLRRDSNRLYGRGAADMKGFLACVLAAVPDLVSRQLATPIHIAFSYDEEIGCVGVRPMIEELGRSLPRPRIVIVGEPTSMRVVDAHKGPIRWQIDVIGRAAHSSMAHLGVNAITYAGRILTVLEEIGRDIESRFQDDRFEPPSATLQVVRIEGGTASNIVPISCRLGFEVRALPGLDPLDIEARVQNCIDRDWNPDMRRVAPEAGVSIKLLNHVPPFGASSGSDAVALALSLAGQNETFAVSYATEAGLFQNAGSAAVICGPGDIAQAHTADEWIAESQIEACVAFLDRLGRWAES